MNRRLGIAATIALGSLTGCGAADPGLSARIDRLEAEVASLKATQGDRALAQRISPRCDRVLDATFPESTPFPYQVDFDLGKTDVPAGDRIVIKEIRGSRAGFEKGGIYLVRGEYTLGSADEADLGLYVSATRAGEGCTSGNPRGTSKVKRGSGTFELATPILYEGLPHVSFYVRGRGGHFGNGAGGVYFGKGDFVHK